MGKKTRQEKIIADLRRKVQGRQTLPAAAQKISFTPNIEPPKVVVQPAEGVSQTESLYVYPVHLIRKDLTKTFLLSILAISLEVALFLLLEQHLVLPFRISF